jgi:hypothetical protein
MSYKPSGCSYVTAGVVMEVDSAMMGQLDVATTMEKIEKIERQRLHEEEEEGKREEGKEREETDGRKKRGWGEEK